MNRIKQIWEAQEKAYREMMEDEQYCHPESFRWGFEQGVDWAEKDLMLTWIDIRNILSIAREVEDENDDCPLLKSELCDEILKRFNEQRKK